MNRIVLTGLVAVALLAQGPSAPAQASPFATGIEMEDKFVLAKAQRLVLDLPGQPVHVAIQRGKSLEIIAGDR